MKLKLPTSVYSPQDVEELLLALRQYSKWFSHNDVKLQAGASPSEPLQLPAAAEELLAAWHGKKEVSIVSLDQLIEALERLRDTAPTIVITLAAPAGPQLKSHLTEWCRAKLREDVLVNFSFDSSLLGGMVVRWGSHIYDWSFRRQILQQRAQFSEVLRNV